MALSTSKITSSEIESYFLFNKVRIKTLLKAFYKTPHGRQIKNPIYPEKYSEFRQIPFLDDNLLASNSAAFYLPSQQDIEFISSGTTGIPKKCFWVSAIKAMPFSSRIDQIIKNKNTVFVHSSRLERESYYWIHDKTYREDYPTASFLQYNDLKSAASIASQGEVLCIYEYPSAFYRFLFYIKKSLSIGLLLPNDIYKELILVELSGEPVDINDLEFISTEVETLFGIKPEICISYGANETGLIGQNQYNRGNKTIEYAVTNQVFLEVVDQETGEPHVGKMGEIIITPLQNRGTILPRYRIGDQGILEFKQGKPFVRMIERLPQFHSISIAGAQFSINALEREFREQLGITLRISAQRQVDTTTGTEAVHLKLYFEEGLEIHEDILRSFALSRIVDMAELHSEVEMKTVHISVEIVSENDLSKPRKGWQISNKIN